MKVIHNEYKGILLASALGMAVYFLAPSNYSILAGFLVGLLIGNFISIPEAFSSGITFTGGKLLELSILFLAFSINYTHIADLGVKSFTLLILVVFIASALALYLARKMKCPGSTGWLIGIGNIICGSSAIAALAPTVTKSKEEVGISIAVVNLLGSIGMLVMPLVLMRTNFTPSQTGIILGGTLQSIGNVAGAGYSLGNEIGEHAITIKLARVALLSPILIFFNYFINKDQVKNWKEHFMLPWYLWSFIGITILTSFVSFPDSFIKLMETFGKIVLTIALCAIGLRVSFKVLYQSGRRGISYGIVMFAIQIILVMALMIYI